MQVKIAICAKGPELSSDTDPRMGRCAWFVLVDAETGIQQGALENPCAAEGSGAGVRAVQFLRESDVSVVVANSIGPHAIKALSAVGIVGYTGVSGTVANGLEQYQSGQLTVATGSEG